MFIQQYAFINKVNHEPKPSLRFTIVDTSFGVQAVQSCWTCQHQNYVSIPEMWHKHRQTLPFILPLLGLLYCNFQSGRNTLFILAGIQNKLNHSPIPHSLSKMSEVPFKVMPEPKIFRVIWQFVNISGAFRQSVNSFSAFRLLQKVLKN